MLSQLLYTRPLLVDIETFFLAFPHFQYKFCLSNFYLMTSFRAKKQGETMLLEKNPTETKVNICVTTFTSNLS